MSPSKGEGGGCDRVRSFFIAVPANLRCEANNDGRAARVSASRSSFFRLLFFRCLRRRRFAIGWLVVPAQDIVSSQWLVETFQGQFA